MAKKTAKKKTAAKAAKVETKAEALTPEEIAEKLRSETIAIRFSRQVFGAQRKLNADQKATAADAFSAADGWVRGSKVLLDTKREEYKRASGRVLAALAYWREVTTPYPEPGIRLLRRSKLNEFEATMNKIREELKIAVDALDAVYAEAREQAKLSLVDLYDPADYPPTLKGSFGFSWGFPSVDPPEYLRKLNPEVFKQQQAIVNARFATAVAEAEQMLALELAKMLDRWIANLAPGEDGKRKTIRKDSVEGFKELLARVKEMSPGANSTLKKVVDEAELVANGIDVSALKNDGIAASALKDRIASLQQSLAVVVEDAPERAIDLED